MAINYSFENLRENIFHSKTKRYFEEVTQTYYSECYRSSVVMLYSVVICDLIFKLEDLRDVYADEKAEKILAEISRLQSENPRSADWETKLIEMIFERTKLLEISDFENINQLQKHRHLSAHPVLNQTSILFKPSKENVKSHIRNMLEGVLTKPPILSKKIFNELIADIADNQYRFKEKKDLQRYLDAKYFRNLRQETVHEIFKSLWKLVFKINNDECKTNREVNYKTLTIIINKNEAEIIKKMQEELAHFDGVLPNEPTMFLFELLFHHPKIYSALSDITKAHIDFEIGNKSNYQLLSWFKYDSFHAYISTIIESVKTGNNLTVNAKTFNKIKMLADDFNMNKELLDLSITIFSKSIDYYAADNHFKYIVAPYLEDYSNDQLIQLIDAVNCNSQNSHRNAAASDNRKIKEICDRKLIQPFDYSKCNYFFY